MSLNMIHAFFWFFLVCYQAGILRKIYQLDMTSTKVQTVLGSVSPNDLGITLTDEHLSVSGEFFFQTPKECDLHLSNSPWTLDNYGWIHQWPYSHRNNLTLTDKQGQDAVIESLKNFKKAGGGCIVENSTFGMNRKTESLKKLSQESEIHIIVGTGYYVAPYQSKSLLNTATVETMTNFMNDELTIGAFDCPEIRCGFIGEIGCSYPLHDFERKCIQASALAQINGVPVGFHPGRDAKSPFEIMRVFTEAGGNAKKALVGHIERTLPNFGDLADFADEFGSFCQFDLFGIENSYYQLKPSIDFPSDAQRIALVQNLIDEKYEDKILLSHDIHTKHRLEKFGGHGFKHILTATVPKMLAKGIAQEQINKMLIYNPAALFST